MTEYARSWMKEERRYQLMEKIGKRMIASGHLLSKKRKADEFCEVVVYWVARFGFMWRLVTVDGQVSEIHKLQAV